MVNSFNVGGKCSLEHFHRIIMPGPWRVKSVLYCHKLKDYSAKSIITSELSESLVTVAKFKEARIDISYDLNNLNMICLASITTIKKNKKKKKH